MIARGGALTVVRSTVIRMRIHKLQALRIVHLPTLTDGRYVMAGELETYLFSMSTHRGGAGERVC